MRQGDSIPWPFVALACVVGLSAMCWRHARPPACPACGVPLAEETSAVVTDSAPVVETVYWCPRCGHVSAQRTGRRLEAQARGPAARARATARTGSARAVWTRGAAPFYDATGKLID